ncbi:Cysteine-rich receptor-like protein kinase 2, partial [Mucuna pruriens]
MLKLNLVAITLIWWCPNIVHAYGAVANPQTHLLYKGCSTYNASNLSSFFANINGTFSRVRDQVSNHRKHFATADEARGEVLTYTMFQCRNYLSRIDCLVCFNTATTQIRRNCSAANHATVIYDGCYLRYDRGKFYNESTEPGNGVSCGNMSAKGSGFREAGKQVLMDLQTATPKIKGFYAATKTQVDDGSAIYAVAQCVETATESDCLKCMTVGYHNLQSCLPKTEGRAYDAGCFMRYSTTPFFADNQTIDITPYLNQVANPLLSEGCSSYNVSNLRSFFANINGTFSRLREQISNESKHFFIDEAKGEVMTYTMFQCRNYLSMNDCLACFNTATTQIRNCSAANGARAVYEDCFLRYESAKFYDQTTDPGNGVLCGNTSLNTSNFRLAGQQVLMDLQTATPKIQGFYAATKTQVDGVGAIYGVAQCVETAAENDCLKCMQVGYDNLQSCFPNTDGTAYDAGCFMRYSTTPFFADNQIIDITLYLDQVGKPQTHLLKKRCNRGTYEASNLSSFFANINETFSILKAQISVENKHFGVADKAMGGVMTYAMFQCRNYLSQNNCLACFNTASTLIRNCSAANGATVIYDGCFLRYDSEKFYNETTESGNDVSCGNKSANYTGFKAAGQQVLMDLQTVTPKIKGFYAATKTQVADDSAIYAVAQCVETVTESDCLKCMSVGYNKLQSCLPNTEGIAYDAGCFMRYSTTPFFADNQTIDITSYLKQGRTTINSLPLILDE